MKNIIRVTLIIVLLIFLGGITVYSLTFQEAQDRMIQQDNLFKENIEEYNLNLTINVIISIILIISLLVILVLYITNRKNNKFKSVLNKLFIGINIILSLLLYYIKIKYESVESMRISSVMIIRTYTLEKIILGLYILMIILGLFCWKNKKPKVFGIAITTLNIMLIIINIMTVHYITY